MLDLARAWGDAFLPLLSLDEFEDASLPLGQHDPNIEETEGSRKFKRTPVAAALTLRTAKRLQRVR
jgi:hypothetical protein